VDLAPVKALIRERLGLRFEGPAEAHLRQAVAGQMAALGIAQPADYLVRLRGDPPAMQALTSLLTIKETYFYREPEHLRLLTEHLAPRLLSGRGPDDPVRILSVGCATGEEPYSIAIALHERWGESADRLFQLSAGDVDHLALAQARAGRYRPFSFRAMPTDLVPRWFSEPARGERLIAESLRRRVAFVPMNVLAVPRSDGGPGPDLIFYRNLSIYFDEATRALVQGRLRARLRPGGYLIVGAAETLANDFGLMALVELAGVWCFADRAPDRPRLGAASRGTTPAAAAGTVRASRGGERLCRDVTAREGDTQGAAPTAVPGPAPTGAGPRGGAGAEAAAAERAYQEALTLARAERVDAALARLAVPRGMTDPTPNHLILQAQLLLERRDLDAARAAALRVLDGDPWSVEALVLLGRIARRQGAVGEAVGHLRRAVYQRPGHWPAHYELAECHRAAEQPQAAGREYRIVLRQLTDPCADAVVALDQAGPLPSVLTLSDLRLLCQARLERLAVAP
jgi:chemotaxis protein methyltransferase CheR